MESSQTSHSCPLCKTVYDETTHRPKILACDHTLCKQCITSLGEKFDCPVCTCTIFLPDPSHVLMLPTNFLELDCHMSRSCCSDMTKSSCSDIDSLQLSTESNLPDVVTPKQRRAAFCSKNKERLKKWDSFESDGSSCSEAAIVKEKEAESKNSGPLHAEFFEAITGTADKLEQLEQSLQLYEAVKNQCFESIDQQFDHMVQVINRRRHLLKNQVLGMYEEKVENIEDNVEQLTCSLHCLDKLQTHSKPVLMECTGDKLEENTAKVLSEIKELSESTESMSGDAKMILFEVDEEKVKAMEMTSRQIGRINNQYLLPANVQLQDSNFPEGWLEIRLEDSQGNAVHTCVLETLIEVVVTGDAGKNISIQKTVPESGVVHLKLDSTQSVKYSVSVSLGGQSGVVLKRLLWSSTEA